MTGSKRTRAGIRDMQAYTVAAVSAFFDRRRRRRGRRVTCLIILNYPRMRCLRLLVGTLCGLTIQKTNQGGIGLSGSVHEEAHPCFPNLV